MGSSTAGIMFSAFMAISQPGLGAAEGCSSLLMATFEIEPDGTRRLVDERCLESRGATLLLIDDPDIPTRYFSRPVEPSWSDFQAETIEPPPTVIIVPAPESGTD